MRICQSILAIILVIISVSCQSSPQRPVGRMSQPQPAQPTAPAPEGASAAMPGETDSSKAAPADKFSEATQAKDDQGAVSKTIALGGKAKPPEKKPPIKPVIAPVQTGLLSPLTQEVPSGSPGSAQKEKQRIVLNFEKADIAEVTNQIFSDQLKLNYVMDQTLQGRISMYIEGDFENDELLQMVARAYEANGISIIPKKGFYFIQLPRRRAAAVFPWPMRNCWGKTKGTRPLIVIYRLRFMDPSRRPA